MSVIGTLSEKSFLGPYEYLLYRTLRSENAIDNNARSYKLQRSSSL